MKHALEYIKISSCTRQQQRIYPLLPSGAFSNRIPVIFRDVGCDFRILTDNSQALSDPSLVKSSRSDSARNPSMQTCSLASKSFKRSNVDSIEPGISVESYFFKALERSESASAAA